MIKQETTRSAPSPAVEVVYPACFHFRIITDTEAKAEQALQEAVTPFDVTAPLVAARASSAGHYTAFSVSIMMRSRQEMETFDASIKQVHGVRIVL